MMDFLGELETVGRIGYAFHSGEQRIITAFWNLGLVVIQSPMTKV